MASPTTQAAGTAQVSLRSKWAEVSSPVAISTDRRDLRRVGMAFMAAPRRTSSPLVMPPSSPPARFVMRAGFPSRMMISSCARLPGRRERRNPSPASTPLMPGMDMSAAAKRPSRRRSHSTWEPMPGGRPARRTRNVPPKVSPFSAVPRMCPARRGSSPSLGTPRSLARARFHSSSVAGGGLTSIPMEVTAPKTFTPSSARRSRASVPARVQAAVWRALALSRTFLRSRWPYLRAPPRSAWPGLGQVAALEAAASVSTGPGSRTGFQVSHSEFSRTRPTGAPVVSPSRTPHQMARTSRSSCIRGPRPKPLLLRASSAEREAAVTGSPEGSPSTRVRRPLPWDSPPVRNRRVIVSPPLVPPRCRASFAGPCA